MERSIQVLLGVASFVLAVVVWLAFHDFAEAHTVRDWLTLLAAVLVWSSTALALRPAPTRRRNVAGVSGA
jgi:hypothetical protein